MAQLRFVLLLFFGAFVFTMLGLYFSLSLSLFQNIAALPFTWAPGSRLDALHRPKLRFTSQGTFQLSVFEDLHYGEGENTAWGPQQDIESTLVMNTILNNESPQLVVLNGDLITGENVFLENATAYVDLIVQPLVERGLAWASAYGNHDSSFNISRQGIYSRESSYPGCLTGNMVHGNSSGLTNYFLPVYSATGGGPFSGEEEQPALLLWFFDSRGGYEFQKMDSKGSWVGIPEWVDRSVVDWFTKTKAQIAAKWHTTIPSLAFFHIPVFASTAFQFTGVDAYREPGINDDNPLSPQGIVDGVYSGADYPFMKALLETDGLIATFSGHDHGDDWCFKWTASMTFPEVNLTGNGLNLCFGRHSGYGGYGTWTRGSRQILLNMSSLGNSTETWIRLEDGTVSGKVVLNATYGQDIYPMVNDTHTGKPT